MMPETILNTYYVQAIIILRQSPSYHKTMSSSLIWNFMADENKSNKVWLAVDTILIKYAYVILNLYSAQNNFALKFTDLW